IPPQVLAEPTANTLPGKTLPSETPPTRYQFRSHEARNGGTRSCVPEGTHPDPDSIEFDGSFFAISKPTTGTNSRHAHASDAEA
ncbi:MAG TPA: hypothetical protein VIY86_10355, partial [Pirellulaceae bacterium]